MNRTHAEHRPLAERMRPATLKAVVGQEHLIGNDQALSRLIKAKQLPSILFWGPPGTGKTTLARILASELKRPFEQLSAVDGTVKDVRAIIERAEGMRRLGEPTPILFIDEIHRFNSAQQDALLHAVELGVVTLIGATTENPSFKVNAPLLSRMRVMKLESLGHKALHELIRRALKLYPEHKIKKEAVEFLIASADGDARTLLGTLEVALALAINIDLQIMEQAVQRKTLRYDQGGEAHYDTISAFIKSMRGSDPTAALHYLARMVEAGEDPLFIARRMVIFAAEDIGNIQPTALVLATNTMQAVHMVGYPEARIIPAQCATYLATAPKSRAVINGINGAISDIQTKTIPEIPLHLRNAPTKLMKELGYGQGDKNVLGYLPDALKGTTYYVDPRQR